MQIIILLILNSNKIIIKILFLCWNFLNFDKFFIIWNTIWEYVLKWIMEIVLLVKIYDSAQCYKSFFIHRLAKFPDFGRILLLFSCFPILLLFSVFLNILSSNVLPLGSKNYKRILYSFFVIFQWYLTWQNFSLNINDNVKYSVF